MSNAIGFMAPNRSLMKYIHASMYPPPLAQLQSCHYDDRYTDNMMYNIFSSNIHGEHEFSKRFKLISIAIHDQQNHVTMYEHNRCTGYYSIHPRASKKKIITNTWKGVDSCYTGRENYAIRFIENNPSIIAMNICRRLYNCTNNYICKPTMMMLTCTCR